MTQIRFTMFLILALSFLPGQLAAQGPHGGDAGQYVILSAQYGHERRHVDVTDRLKELARADRVFRASNDVFGVDPDPGVRKTLRIYARGPNGHEEMFEYREGSVVDGAQFRGWRGGNWGSGGRGDNWAGGGNRDINSFRGEDRDSSNNNERGGDRDEGRYVILSAQYGHERRHVDVTHRLKELARAGQTFRAVNNVFGVDPDPGVRKTLRIYARGPNGHEEMFEYREGSVVDGAQFRGWRSGNWGGGWSGNWR